MRNKGKCNNSYSPWYQFKARIFLLVDLLGKIRFRVEEEKKSLTSKVNQQFVLNL